MFLLLIGVVSLVSMMVIKIAVTLNQSGKKQVRKAHSAKTLHFPVRFPKVYILIYNSVSRRLWRLKGKAPPFFHF